MAAFSRRQGDDMKTKVTTHVTPGSQRMTPLISTQGSPFQYLLELEANVTKCASLYVLLILLKNTRCTVQLRITTK